MHLNFYRFFNAFFRFFSENVRFWVPSWVRAKWIPLCFFLLFRVWAPVGLRAVPGNVETDFDTVFDKFLVIFGLILVSIFERFVMVHRQVFSEKKARGGIGA